MTYLSEQPYVTAVGMVGVCTSASNGAYLAAEEEGLASRVKDAAEARRKFKETGEATTIPVYSETDPQAANYNRQPGAYDCYTNPARGNVPQYRNEFDVTSWDTWTSLDALGRAAGITAPTIVVHSDLSAFPEQARQLHDNVQGVKELVWAEGNHFDFYDSLPQIDNAVANVSRFFRTHLV